MYKKFQPCVALKPYVMCFYVLEHPQYLHAPLVLQTPPSGLAGIVFHYGDPYRILNDKQDNVQVPAHFLAGQFKKNNTLSLHGQVGMIGIAFWPAALAKLLAIPMIEFSDQRVDLRLVLGNESDNISEQIRSSQTNLQRIQILERFLMHKLHRLSTTEDLVDHAIQKIIQHKGILSIRQLTDDLCISPRQFRRRFTEKVGITPKLFARIKRFNYISYLSTSAYTPWMDIVHQGGYYDQSHFIKDCCDFSGQNPSDFLNYHRTLSQMVGT